MRCKASTASMSSLMRCPPCPLEKLVWVSNHHHFVKSLFTGIQQTLSRKAFLAAATDQTPPAVPPCNNLCPVSKTHSGTQPAAVRVAVCNRACNRTAPNIYVHEFPPGARGGRRCRTHARKAFHSQRNVRCANPKPKPQALTRNPTPETLTPGPLKPYPVASTGGGWVRGGQRERSARGHARHDQAYLRVRMALPPHLCCRCLLKGVGRRVYGEGCRV